MTSAVVGKKAVGAAREKSWRRNSRKTEKHPSVFFDGSLRCHRETKRADLSRRTMRMRTESGSA